MAGSSAPDPVEHARRLFLESRNLYGCAETTFAVLKTVYGLDDPEDTSAAMALNGGVGYGGGICGAISGGALAVGLLAGRRLTSHRQAKRVAREVTAQVMDEFAEVHGAAGLPGPDRDRPPCSRGALGVPPERRSGRTGAWPRCSS